jgi:CBS domain-containing protein
VVVDAQRRPIGMLTDRDLVVRVMAAGRDPERVTVADAMSRSPRVHWEHSPIEDALATMRAGVFRRLPVTDADGVLVGLLSADDVLELLAEELDAIRRLVAAQTHPARPAIEPR